MLIDTLSTLICILIIVNTFFYFKHIRLTWKEIWSSNKSSEWASLNQSSFFIIFTTNSYRLSISICRWYRITFSTTKIGISYQTICIGKTSLSCTRCCICQCIICFTFHTICIHIGWIRFLTICYSNCYLSIICSWSPFIVIVNTCV